MRESELRIMSPTKLSFPLEFRLQLNRRHETERRTDGRSATLHRPDTSVLWPPGGAAKMRARCW